LKLQTLNYMYVKIRSIDTILPQSRVEKDKQLHDMVQKYSSGEIFLVNTTIVLLFFNTKKNGIMRLSPYLHVYVYICFKLLK
jgi:hypothetical protein